MKQTVTLVASAILLLASCGPKEKPSTAPVHPSQPSIVATTQDEMRDIVTSMTGSTDWKALLSSDFYSLMDEAQYLYMGNSGGESYSPWDWSCGSKLAGRGEVVNNVGDISIGEDSVTVAMTCAYGSTSKPYTLVMKHENGHWCIDDVVWPGQQPPLDTERHRASAYANDAIDNLTNGDANFIITSRLHAMVPDPSTPPEARGRFMAHSIKSLETAHHYLRQNRSYSPTLEQQLQEAIEKLKKQVDR